ncbi:hypothetical protein ElyMa_001209300 [Elysia marginata]|uniref:Uncharacterized protein n=1 Tax=Elysia marginata TaxID=1093978 RepID=A0AAV4I6Y6_9GAST|nr:hypothetical protein ElyMa_001209300 [Elysia marginata]
MEQTAFKRAPVTVVDLIKIVTTRLECVPRDALLVLRATNANLVTMQGTSAVSNVARALMDQTAVKTAAATAVVLIKNVTT